MRKSVFGVVAVLVGAGATVVALNWTDVWLVLPSKHIAKRVNREVGGRDFEAALAWAEEFCNAKEDRRLLSVSRETGVRVMDSETIGEQHIYLTLGDHPFTGGTEVGCVLGFDVTGNLTTTHVFKAGTFMR